MFLVSDKNMGLCLYIDPRISEGVLLARHPFAFLNTLHTLVLKYQLLICISIQSIPNIHLKYIATLLAVYYQNDVKELRRNL